MAVIIKLQNASNNLPTVSFYTSPVNSYETVTTNVFKGQTLILMADVIFPRSIQQTVNFNLSGPVGSAVDIVDFSVVFVGLNLPCIDKSQFNSTIAS